MGCGASTASVSPATDTENAPTKTPAAPPTAKEPCRKPESTDAKIAEVFAQFDTSGDGYLQLDELKRAFRAIGLEKRKGEKYELDQKTFEAFDKNNDGKISLEEFNVSLHPKTRAKIMEKLDAGWVFDSAKWTESIERHSKWNMAKVFKQVRSAAAAGRDVCSRSS
jgi:Ca2+-binding EF-hand superfamily protein